MFMIQNGLVRADGNWKIRGMGIDKSKNIPMEHINTTETKDGRVVITPQRLRPQRLKSAVIRGRISDIGKFQPYTKEININADNKRFLLGKLHSIHDDVFFNSVALDVNLDGVRYSNPLSIEFYHRSHSSHLALVYDMIEPFRHVVDRSVFEIQDSINRKDYTFSREGVVVLSYELKKRYIDKLSEILDRKRDYKARTGIRRADGF